MDKFKFRTPYNYDHTKEHYEEYDLVNEPSLTQPDETLSIKEILYRFTNGISPFAGQELPYDPEGITIDDDVNPANDMELSLSDIHERMELHYQRYKDMVELEKQKMDEKKESSDSVPSA